MLFSEAGKGSGLMSQMGQRWPQGGRRPHGREDGALLGLGLSPHALSLALIVNHLNVT